VSGGAALILDADPSKKSSAVLAELLDGAVLNALTGLRTGDTNALLYVGAGGPPPTPEPVPTPAPPPSVCDSATATGPDSDGDCRCNSGLTCYEGSSSGCTYSYTARYGWKSSRWYLPSCTTCQCRGSALGALAEEEEPATIIGGILIPIARELAEKIGKELLDNSIDWAKELARTPTVQASTPDLGAVWVTQVNGTWGTFGGKVISAYYHPSRTHSATTDGKVGEKRSVAAAGEWAVSAQTRAMWGNKAYYNNL